jgi:hypothetical protein
MHGRPTFIHWFGVTIVHSARRCDGCDNSLKSEMRSRMTAKHIHGDWKKYPPEAKASQFSDALRVNKNIVLCCGFQLGNEQWPLLCGCPHVQRIDRADIPDLQKYHISAIEDHDGRYIQTPKAQSLTVERKSTSEFCLKYAATHPFAIHRVTRYGGNYPLAGEPPLVRSEYFEQSTSRDSIE